MGNKTKQQGKTRLRIEDEVVVISGKSKNQRGRILAIDVNRGRVIVQGVNLRKRFARPTQENPKGGVVELEAPLSLSNVMYYDSKTKKPTRIRYGVDKNGKKIRILAKSGKEIG